MSHHAISDIIRQRLQRKGVTFRANESIIAQINPGELDLLQREVEARAAALLDSLVIDVANDHNTVGTAKRMAKMLVREVCAGRFTAPPSLTTFPNHGRYDELVVTGPITIRSLCSHHFCPILGRCWVGIIPGKRVAGLSKFNRIVDWFASRPQIQEELVVQIADYLETELAPKGVGVVIRAAHTCMTWRGVREHPGAEMTTNVMRGVFRDKPEARAEFLGAIREA